MSTAGKFIKLDKLGEGTYGVVYKAKDRANGAVVALKRMNFVPEEEGVPATTIREICLLKELRHDNIVRLHDVMFASPKLTLVFEFCEWDLKKYMDMKLKDEGRSLHLQAEVKPFLKQLLLGLAYMHSRSVVHRDLKPQNLLISEALELKLADFGLARVEGIPVKKYSHEAVTLWYRPPDVILGSTNYGLAIDIWSAGCIFAETVTGQPLFSAGNEKEQLRAIFKVLGTPTTENWPSLPNYPNTKALVSDLPPASPVAPMTAAIAASAGPQAHFMALPNYDKLAEIGPDGFDLLYRMLQYEPSRRITADEALAHPFLADVVIAPRVPVDVPSSVMDGSPVNPRHL